MSSWTRASSWTGKSSPRSAPGLHAQASAAGPQAVRAALGAAAEPGHRCPPETTHPGARSALERRPAAVAGGGGLLPAHRRSIRCRAGHALRPGRGSLPRDRLLASTLKRLPLGLKPFGPPSAQLRSLVIDAPPKRLIRALGPLLSGAQPPWLEAAGYYRRTVAAFDVELDTRFVLDGEVFP